MFGTKQVRNKRFLEIEHGSDKKEEATEGHGGLGDSNGNMVGGAERGGESDRTGQGTWSRLQSERRSSLFSASTRRWYSFTDTTW